MLRQPRLRFTDTPGGWRSDGSAVSVIIAREQDAGGGDYQRVLSQMWRALQYPQARLSTRGKALPVDAGRAVFRERPAAVIAAMLDMIEAAAGQKK